MTGTQLSANLRDNAVFQLSLSSKELFHSNFLCWLADSQTDLFNYILENCFGVSFKYDPKTMVALREYKNFDFCICDRLHEVVDDDEDDNAAEEAKTTNSDNKDIDDDKHGRLRLVLENKFKSIPRKDQLDEYYQKALDYNFECWKKDCRIQNNFSQFRTNSSKNATADGWGDVCFNDFVAQTKNFSKLKSALPHFVLLTLAEDFADRKSIESEGIWKIASYQEYADALEKNFGMLQGEQFTKDLVMKYQQFVKEFVQYANDKLSQIQVPGSWRGAFQSGLDNDIRMDDIWQKLVASKLCAMIATKYGYTFAYDDKEVVANAKIGEVYTDAGFSNGTGSVNVRLKISETCFFMIQIQGEQYRRVMWAAKDSGAQTEKAVLQTNLETNKSKFNMRLAGHPQNKPCHLEDILLGVWPKTVCPLGLCQPIAGKLFRYHDVPKGFMFPKFVKNNTADQIYPDISNSTTKRGFNKYDTNFVYQYYKIGEEVTIKEVFDAIQTDIENVKQILRIS